MTIPSNVQPAKKPKRVKKPIPEWVTELKARAAAMTREEVIAMMDEGMAWIEAQEQLEAK